jgi:hypothetical protein
MGIYPNEYSPGDYFTVLNNLDSPYETDDVVVNGLPVAPVTAAIGADYNRYLALGGGDGDWFTFTLP